MFIDSHCHIDTTPFTGDIGAVLDRMKQAQVSGALLACCSLNEFPNTLDFAEKHPGVWASFGVHPSTEDDPREVTLEDFTSQTKSSKVIAIGECGLDYYYNEEPLDWQRNRFAIHIEGARSANLPLIVHSRDAKEDTIALLKEGKADECGFVLHCFTGDENMARQALDLGGYLSFSGILTFKNATEIQKVASWAPLDRLLIETDCPYLAPIPYRGKRNEPSYVPFVASKLANLRQVSVEEIASATVDNFFQLFRKADRSQLITDFRI